MRALACTRAREEYEDIWIDLEESEILDGYSGARGLLVLPWFPSGSLS